MLSVRAGQGAQARHMYLLVSHIPVHVDGDKTFTDISWQKDVLLARDWLAAGLGPLTLLAPAVPVHVTDGQSMQLAPIGRGDGVRVVPSMALHSPARFFWAWHRRRWVADLRRELATAKVIHCSAIEDVVRPLWYVALKEGVRAGVTTVLVGPDTDPHLVEPAGLRRRLICRTFDWLMARASRRADLVLLKEGAVHKRYGRGADNVRAFCHSMHHDEDVIPADRLEQRLSTLSAERPLRAVFAGRFIPIKGLVHAIDAIAAARRQGTDVEYHLFGSGPDEPALRQRAAEQGVGDLVRFHGFVEHGPAFIARLAEYDLLLFLSAGEDTARMVYDAMAAGLPLVGTRTAFLEHRVAADQTGVLVDIGRWDQAAEMLCRLSAGRQQLAALSRSALAGGRRHSVEQWYRRRGEWTREAVANSCPGDASKPASAQMCPQSGD